jgi:hypothetical protein
MGLADLHNFDKEGRPSVAHTDISLNQFVKVQGHFKLNDFNRVGDCNNGPLMLLLKLDLLQIIHYLSRTHSILYLLISRLAFLRKIEKPRKSAPTTSVAIREIFEVPKSIRTWHKLKR